VLGCAPYNESPTVFPTCNPATLPAGLHTGYFKITIFDPKAGCPNDGLGPPPAPFTECHFGLNKD